MVVGLYFKFLSNSMTFQLEPRLGSARFASVIGALVVGSSAVYCALQYLAAQALGTGHLHSCAAGFSCVLFGLKVHSRCSDALYFN